LERELKELVVEALGLEDVSPQDIVSGDPLFVEGLGLDSIDALELAMAVSKKYKIKMDAKSTNYRGHFASIHSLAKFIASARGKE
jgi:acyl carrier protein